MDVRSVGWRTSMTWDWLYFIHAGTDIAEFDSELAGLHGDWWGVEAASQWTVLRDVYARELVEPLPPGRAGFAMPRGLDGPEFTSLADSLELRAWCSPLWPRFMEWRRGKRPEGFNGGRPGWTGEDTSLWLSDLRMRLPAERQVRIVALPLLPRRVLHRVRSSGPLGTFVGLVVTHSLLVRPDEFTEACRGELFG
jgi:hypothetical protein